LWSVRFKDQRKGAKLYLTWKSRSLCFQRSKVRSKGLLNLEIKELEVPEIEDEKQMFT